jgi:hypothetical protein
MKNCPACGREAADPAAECLFCGIVFAKWQTRKQSPPTKPLRAVPRAAPGALLTRPSSLLGALVGVLAMAAAYWYVAIYTRDTASSGRQHEVAPSSSEVRTASADAEVEQITTNLEERLVGTWLGKIPPGDLHLEFQDGNRMVMVIEGERRTATYSVDERQAPIHFDARFDESNKVKTILRIVDEDTIAFEVVEPNQTRPTSFGNGEVIFRRTGGAF